MQIRPAKVDWNEVMTQTYELAEDCLQGFEILLTRRSTLILNELDCSKNLQDCWCPWILEHLDLSFSVVLFDILMG